MTSRLHGRMASKARLADMSLPAKERHRKKRKTKRKRKGAKPASRKRSPENCHPAGSQDLS